MYTQQTHYFLGANSPGGFYSLYDELIDLRTSDTLYILSGGPGSGKSGFLSSIADSMISSGLEVEYIHSLEDPSALDAINIPALGIAYADGTAPHTIEAKFPGAVERHIDLGGFYDPDGLKPHKLEIMEITRAYKALYNRAYDCITAAWGIMRKLGSHILDEGVFESVHKRAKGIIAREIPKGNKSPAKTRKRFLTAVTHQGHVSRFDTIENQADRVYLLDNDLGLSHLLISDIANAATSAGHDIVLCPSPLDPDRLEHLIIPSLSLAFVSQSHYLEYSGERYRHIRLDAMVEGERLKSYKARIRFSRKIFGILMQESADILSDTKKLYDELEGIYSPCTDIDGINALADTHVKLLLDKINQKDYIDSKNN